ncbi:alpha/beta hydrolase [Gemella cuniculi]|uniref:alpha/beta hydrolase n=1 Tax=Gemella cuniculi TaxID=150240 RepID=UPI00040C07F5|nr:alpha/beta hydrolase [Gemella cuniculi]
MTLETRVFEIYSDIKVEEVRFKNRFGIELRGHLYLPTDLKNNKGAVGISGPFGAVKEQSSGLYAQELAKKGFVALAFDPSFTGESGGEVHNIASPDINTEDFSAAVDFLGTRSYVNREKIGVLGICGFGGFALNAASQDPRIKATITSTMYDMTRVAAVGYFDGGTMEERYSNLERISAQRFIDFEKGYQEFQLNGFPEELTGEEPQFFQDYYNYYATPRGYHENSINSASGWTKTSGASLVNSKILEYADQIRNAVLMIHGEKAHSRYLSEDAFKKLKGDNKELYIIPNANHVDLYDKKDVIPFAKIVCFLEEFNR